MSRSLPPFAYRRIIFSSSTKIERKAIFGQPRSREPAKLAVILCPKYQAEVKGPVIQIDKIPGYPVGYCRHDRFRSNNFGNTDQRAKYADIKDHRFTDLLHDSIVHRQLDLFGIHLAGDLHIAAVGQQGAAGPDDRGIAVIGILGQADQDIGLGDFRKVDLAVGDDDIASGGAAAGCRAIALGLGGIHALVDNRRLGQNYGRRDHSLAAGAGEYKSYSAHDFFSPDA